jgi:hypothetical protein
MIAKVRVKLVLSIAIISPSRPCPTSPALDKTCITVSCVARKPTGRSAAS